MKIKKTTLIPIIIAIVIVGGSLFLGDALASLGFFSTDSLNKGLVGHWPLDSAHLNSTTNRVDDISGYSNHGTNVGATLTTDRYGQSNAAMSFNGTSNYVDTGNGVSLQITDRITFSAWVKIKTYDSERFIVCKGSQNPALDYYSSRFAWTTNGGVSYLYSTTYPVADVWYHVVGTYDKDSGANNRKIFINGIQENQETVTGSMSTSGSLRIGSLGGGYFTKGSISDVRIYNRVLSAAEITRLYQSYKPKLSTGTLNQKLVLDMPLRPTSEKVGSNIVTNGGFDTDTSWTKDSNWTISGGVATANGSNSNSIYQPVGLQAGKTYRYSFNYVKSSGG
ncbi:LamG domain-containing protein, partial [Patescibacteria group bacterium]|nr:LamG domain-containing protein [Patescibacteria group bacterium]